MSRQTWQELIFAAVANGTAVASSTAETILFPNLTIPANYIADGRAMRLTIYGKVGATATPTLTLRLRWGGLAGTVLCATSAVTVAAVTDAIFKIEIVIVVRTNGSSGSVLAIGEVIWGATIKTTNTPDMMGSAGATVPAAVTVDLTADTALAITAQWSANSASNTITGMHQLLEALN